MGLYITLNGKRVICRRVMYDGKVYEAAQRRFVIHGNLLDGRRMYYL